LAERIHDATSRRGSLRKTGVVADIEAAAALAPLGADIRLLLRLILGIDGSGAWPASSQSQAWYRQNL